jgi:hypothetical protein
LPALRPEKPFMSGCRSPGIDADEATESATARRRQRRGVSQNVVDQFWRRSPKRRPWDHDVAVGIARRWTRNGGGQQSGRVDAGAIHAAASRALKDVGLDRRGRSRWYARSPELVWMAQLDRATARPWSVVFGVVIRSWSPDNEWPSYPDAHLFQDYALYDSGVPDAVAQSRFDDHHSYFTTIMDHRHTLVPDLERREAVDFMARDLATFFRRVATLDALASAVRSGEVGGFVDPRLRQLAHGGE